MSAPSMTPVSAIFRQPLSSQARVPRVGAFVRSSLSALTMRWFSLPRYRSEQAAFALTTDVPSGPQDYRWRQRDTAGILLLDRPWMS